MRDILSKIWHFLQLPVWCLVAYVLLKLGKKLGLFLLHLLPKHFLESDAVSTTSLYAVFIAIWIVTLACIGIFKWNRPIFKALGTKASGNTLKNLGLGFLIGGGLNLLCALVAMLNKDIALTYDSFKPVSFILIFVFVFIQSSAEELLCRGYLYQKLRKSYKNPWIAIVVNASLFGVLHMTNPGVTALSIVNIVVVGIFFSLMVYYMDSIWMPTQLTQHGTLCKISSLVFLIVDM